MKISFDGYEAKEQKEYKEGRYVVRITKAIEEKPSGKNPYLEVTFETISDNIFSVKKRFYQTPKALSILLNLLSACGIYDGKSQSDFDFSPDDLVGCMLEVEFKKGKENANGKRYLEYVAWSAKVVENTAKKTETLDNNDTIPF